MILCLAAAAGLVVARLIPRLELKNYPLAAVSVGVLSLLIAPSIWAASTAWYGAETRTPIAGPKARHESGRSLSEADPVMMSYLRDNQGDARYLVGATTSRIANPIILNTDEPVISLGGFGGRDEVFSTERLADLVDEGAVRFFLMREGEDRIDSTEWIQDKCEQVPQKLWQSSTSRQEEAVLLYDCGTEAR